MEPLELVRQARERIAPLVRHTPLLYSESFARIAGGPVYLKAENLQRTGSFKIRGALNKLFQLSPEQKRAGVITASAGNHAQGVALAASHQGVPATVVMPETASLAKYEATLAYGARVLRHGETFDEARAHAEALSRQQGLTYVPAFDDHAVIAGQGTLGLEVLEDLPDPGVVLVPVGGGGLAAGVAATIKALAPGAAVIGVQAEAAAAAARAFRTGRRARVPVQPTIADGIAIAEPGRITTPLLRRYLDDLITVDEESIGHAIVLLLERSKLLVEAAGAVGVAALLSGKVRAGPRPVVAVLSGGNLDVALLAHIVEHGLTVAGRYLSLSVSLPDRPGQLAGLLTHLAALKCNVIEVEHHRTGFPIPVGAVEVQLTLEVQNQAHGIEVRDRLKSLGYEEHDTLLPFARRPGPRAAPPLPNGLAPIDASGSEPPASSSPPTLGPRSPAKG